MLIGDKGIKIKDLFCLCFGKVFCFRENSVDAAFARCLVTYLIYGHTTMLSTLIYLSVCSCEHVCGGMPSDAKALLCFPLFGFLTDSGRSCSTCPMRTARSKRIIPDQTLNIWYPQAGWFGITSVQQCLLWRRQTVLLLVHEDIHYKRAFRDHFW